MRLPGGALQGGLRRRWWDRGIGGVGEAAIMDVLLQLLRP